MISDETYKQLMLDIDHPDSRFVVDALKQVENKVVKQMTYDFDMRLAAVKNQLSSTANRNLRLREVLIQCLNVFSNYVRIHSEKVPPDTEKIERNQEMVNKIEKVLNQGLHDPG